MFRLIYTSRAVADLSNQDISQILATARRRNAAEGITGLLLYNQRHILQVLEGPRDEVEACFHRIKQDTRHSRVLLLNQGPVASAFFTDWFMGYDVLGAEDVQSEAVITLEQLRDRLDQVSGVETSDRKQSVMRYLKLYLLTATSSVPPVQQTG